MLRQRVGDTPARRVWQAALVNDVAPMQAYVRNDGKIVVTLDEFQRGGARNAVVIYGGQGELLRHFLITDLLNAADFRQVDAEARRLTWLDGAKCGFAADGAYFVIQLVWGRTIRIDLPTLQIVRDDATGPEVAGVPPEVLAALLGKLGAGEEEDAAHELEPTDAGAANDGVAAPEAGEDVPVLSAREGDEQGDGLRAALTDAPRGLDARRHVSDAEQRAPAEAAGELPAAARVTAGIDVPLPDPESPVDYVEWLNGLGAVEGPDAGPVYARAMEAFVPWAGDADVCWAAARGDAEALESPELAEWLEQNAAALEAFGEASRYPVKGWEFTSPDGSLLSVELPHLASLRGLARASVIAGRRAAQAGDAYAAADHYLDTLAAGAHIGGGPTVIENLVGIAVQDLAADALLDLQADHPDIDAVMLAEAAEAAYGAIRPPTETVQFERAFFLDTVQRMWRSDPATGKRELDAARALELLDMVSAGDEATEPAGWIEQLASAGFEPTVVAGQVLYDALTEAMREPHPRQSARLDQIEAAVATTEGNPLVRVLVPALSRYAFVSARAEAVRRGALLVTGLNAHAQENGAYPESLEALGAQDLAVDPFSAAPYVYRPTADGFELYSVGGNEVDDGGMHDAKGDTGDLRLWPRPAR